MLEVVDRTWLAAAAVPVVAGESLPELLLHMRRMLEEGGTPVVVVAAAASLLLDVDNATTLEDDYYSVDLSTFHLVLTTTRGQ